MLNRDFNPFLADPRGPGGMPLIGPFSAGGELYQGKTLLPVRFIVAKMAEAGGVPTAASKPLVDALSELVAIHTPAHQFRLGDGLGNRVVFYGDTSVNGSTIDIGHTHIDQVVFELAKQNFRLIKQMVHFDKPAQGGKPEDIVADGAAGSVSQIFWYDRQAGEIHQVTQALGAITGSSATRTRPTTPISSPSITAPASRMRSPRRR